jgi:uroporphyrinogen-III synthase
VRPSAEALLTSDWLLFTSRTTVQAWAALGLPLSHGPRIGAVGARTAADLTQLGARVALSAQPENAQGLLETFVARISPPAASGSPAVKERCRRFPTTSLEPVSRWRGRRSTAPSRNVFQTPPPTSSS